MTAEINHGNPWYLSPDIWVVPGDDPDGTPGIPAAGEGSYVWARVHNTGTVEVENVEVDFYWGNPATTLTPGSCTLIGSSFVSPPPGDAEVLCVSQWVPSWVNNGHECLIVQLIEPGSTPPSPAVPFNPQSDPQCAQHNLSLLASTGTMMNLRFGAGGFRYEGADRGVLRDAGAAFRDRKAEPRDRHRSGAGRGYVRSEPPGYGVRGQRRDTSADPHHGGRRARFRVGDPGRRWRRRRLVAG